MSLKWVYYKFKINLDKEKKEQLKIGDENQELVSYADLDQQHFFRKIMEMIKAPLEFFEISGSPDKKQSIRSQPQQNIFSNWIYYYFLTTSLHQNQLQWNHLNKFPYEG